MLTYGRWLGIYYYQLVSYEIGAAKEESHGKRARSAAGFARCLSFRAFAVEPVVHTSRAALPGSGMRRGRLRQDQRRP